MSKADTPAFSKHAVNAYMGQPVRSPDGQKTVAIRILRDDNADDFPADVVMMIGKKKLTARINFGLNAEVLWSPDSQAFTVSGSEGGAGGLYLTDVFTVSADDLTKIPLSKLIWHKFGHPVRCGWPESPNVGAIAWLEGSTRLLVAAQLIGHSNCDSNFTFRAYEVEIPTRTILRSYNQLIAKKLFKSQLGEWLVGAPDECIRNPKSCWVATNHPEAKSN